MKIRELTIGDYDFIVDLFRQTPGVTFREADCRESTQRYLKRNPGLSFVAVAGKEIIGCVMCGHDGRRGYLQHLVVKQEFRRKGIGEKLFRQCIDALKETGIDKTHIFVFRNNDLAHDFWMNRGWQQRDDVAMYSYNASSNKNV
jgi:N-acetylglutamate synthase